jgi:hypothetical protein
MLHRFTIALAVSAALGAGAAYAAPGEVWHLQKIVLVDKLDAKAELVDHYADSYGGYAMIQVDGALGDVCPGDSATMMFNWGVNVAEIAEGNFVPVRLFASPASYTPCQDVLGAVSHVTVAGSDPTLPPPLSARTMKAVDARRFVDAGTGEAHATPAENKDVDRNLLFVAADPVPGKPYAYFQLRVVIPGSDGELRFVYVFSKDDAPALSPEIGTPPPPPG